MTASEETPPPVPDNHEGTANPVTPPEPPPDVEALYKAASELRERQFAGAATTLKSIQDRAPSTLDDAIVRFRRWQRADPYPDIHPGLLSCGAFCSYIATAGILFPARLSTDAVQLVSVLKL
jgi:hypothetical protein